MAWYFWVIIVLVATAFGYTLGGIAESNYWVDHESDNSCVHHEGQSYRVLIESRAVELEATEIAFNNRLEEGYHHHV